MIKVIRFLLLILLVAFLVLLPSFLYYLEARYKFTSDEGIFESVFVEGWGLWLDAIVIGFGFLGLGSIIEDRATRRNTILFHKNIIETYQYSNSTSLDVRSQVKNAWRMLNAHKIYQIPLIGQVLTNLSFDGYTLKKTELKGCDFRSSEFINCSFENLVFYDCDLRNVHFHSKSFSGIKLVRRKWSSDKLHGLVFPMANLDTIYYKDEMRTSDFVPINESELMRKFEILSMTNLRSIQYSKQWGKNDQDKLINENYLILLAKRGD